MSLGHRSMILWAISWKTKKRFELRRLWAFKKNEFQSGKVTKVRKSVAKKVDNAKEVGRKLDI